MRCPTLAELPPPPSGREGWPWTEESPRLPETTPDGKPWPRISLTTPSYNQADFLEETIRSVLLQGYPDLEYSIFDGGSSDRTVEIIRKYEPWLAHWVSERDRGQSDAVNRGWEIATGDLIAYLCSDDVYLPSTLARVAEAWGGAEDVAMVAGGVVATDEHSRQKGEPRRAELPFPSPLDLSLVDHDRVLLAQPSSFYVRSHLEAVGRWLREDLRYTMDREILYRLCRSGRVVLVPEVLSTYREHADSKTIGSVLPAHQETPAALAYCAWGGAEEQAQRRRVGRWRVAKGHYLYAVHCSSRREALLHLLKAGSLRATYLSPRRAGAARVILNSVGLLRPLRAVKRGFEQLAG